MNVRLGRELGAPHFHELYTQLPEEIEQLDAQHTRRICTQSQGRGAQLEERISRSLWRPGGLRELLLRSGAAPSALQKPTRAAELVVRTAAPRKGRHRQGMEAIVDVEWRRLTTQLCSRDVSEAHRWGKR